MESEKVWPTVVIVLLWSTMAHIFGTMNDNGSYMVFALMIQSD